MQQNVLQFIENHLT